MFFRQRAAANATLSYLFGCAGHRMAIAVAAAGNVLVNVIHTPGAMSRGS
jgi:hypothetical protein